MPSASRFRQIPSLRVHCVCLPGICARANTKLLSLGVPVPMSDTCAKLDYDSSFTADNNGVYAITPVLNVVHNVIARAVILCLLK